MPVSETLASALETYVEEIQNRGSYCPKEGIDESDGFSLDEIDLEGECDVILDVSPIVAEELLGDFGYNDQEVAYGGAWGRIYLPRGMKGEEDRLSPKATLMKGTYSLP